MPPAGRAALGGASKAAKLLIRRSRRTRSAKRRMKTLLVKLLPMKRLPTPLGYAATVGVVFCAAILRLAMSAPLQNYPLILFFPAVFLSALLFDRGSGY